MSEKGNKKSWSIKSGDYISTLNLYYKDKLVAVLDQGNGPIYGWIAIFKANMERKEENEAFTNTRKAIEDSR